MNHVLELFKNLKTKKKKALRKVSNCNLICEKVAISKLIPYCLFFILNLNII